tara:strand:- start:10076 stop:10480 length:405 start_codon:yes stop_codon:yes gene_type:complete
MMNKIFSKNGELLHIHFDSKAFKDDRIDISPDEEYMQVSCLNLQDGKTFNAHKHLENIREITITQESWVVIRGKVKAYYYDTDNELITTAELSAGDCTITFRGGHNYESMEDDTLVYEFKNGPYFGRAKDKELL